MNDSFVEDEEYTRREIHEKVGGGSLQHFLPQKDGRVLCGAFKRQLNPGLPETILVGRDLEESAYLFWRQGKHPVPVFEKIAPGRWKYHGYYWVRKLLDRPDDVAKYADDAGREIAVVLKLRKSHTPQERKGTGGGRQTSTGMSDHGLTVTMPSRADVTKAARRMRAAMAWAETNLPAYEEIDRKAEVLGRYQPLFSSTTVPYLPKQEFLGFLSAKNNHHWPLHRRGPEICRNMPRLRKALGVLVDETRPLEERLNELLPAPKPRIPYLGHGIITAILMVVRPDQYGVWNNRSEHSLKALGLLPHFMRGMPFGDRYRSFNQVLNSLAREVGVDLWTLDLLHYALEMQDKEHRVRSVSAAVDRDLLAIQAEDDYVEGEQRTRLVSYYERRPDLRKAAILKHGTRCQACGMSFAERYGDLGEDFIEVHHLRPVSEYRGKVDVSAEKDMAVVCPNCHRMLHRQAKKPRSVGQLKAIIDARSKV